MWKHPMSAPSTPVPTSSLTSDLLGLSGMLATVGLWAVLIHGLGL